MQVLMQTCSRCNGCGTLDRLDEYVGGEWRAVSSSALDGFPAQYRLQFMQALVEGAPHIFRWADVPCPSCSGKGENLVEFPRVRIF